MSKSEIPKNPFDDEQYIQRFLEDYYNNPKKHKRSIRQQLSDFEKWKKEKIDPILKGKTLSGPELEDFDIIEAVRNFINSNSSE